MTALPATMLANLFGVPTSLWVIVVYLALLLGLGIFSSRFFRKTSSDFFVASRSIGPFMLLMSVFGTTMTAFALVGSTGYAYSRGIGTYGLMASWSGLIHSAVFFAVGIRLWSVGKRRGYVTQCQFLRERFESPMLGYLLFPMLVMLVIPYLLLGLLGAAGTLKPYGIDPWLTGLVLCGVVLTYVFLGGVRSTAWANTFQTLVFMVTGIVAFVLIAKALGGPAAATAAVLENKPDLATRKPFGHLEFFSYFLIPLSVGTFPHVFQHWLTARSAKSFRLVVVAHPLCILLVWLPCVLIGIWAAGHGIDLPLKPDGKPNTNAVLGVMLKTLVDNPLLAGLLLAGILAAIMSSLDSQFMCLSTMFTHDVAERLMGPLTDRRKLWLGRVFVVVIVATVYGLSLLNPTKVFQLGIWCFTGFSGLFPIVFASVYWRRATKVGALAALLVTAGLWIWFFANSGWGADPKYLVVGAKPVLWIFLASIVALVGGSLVSKPPSRETVDLFIPPSA